MSKMELKRTKPDGEIVLGNKLNHVELFFFKTVRIAFRNESYKNTSYFFKKMFQLPKKQDCP